MKCLARRPRNRQGWRCLLVTGAAVLALPSRATAQLNPAMHRTETVVTVLVELRSKRLKFPVAGRSIRDITDTFRDRRGADRLHRASDIRAPRGTPVLSADYGRIVRLDRNAAGGLSIYATDVAGRFIYYYAHLDRYRPGLREGKPLARGDTIAYVGTTGNAPPDAPHLHFAIYRAAYPGRWWRGAPINPFAVFAGGS